MQIMGLAMIKWLIRCSESANHRGINNGGDQRALAH